MKDPVMIDLVGTETNQIPERIKNIAVVTSGAEKDKQEILKDYLLKNTDKKIMMFCETKKECSQFEYVDFASFLPLHGDVSQSHRQNILNKYRQPGCRSILVATDVAARGLDIDDIDVVIQYGVRHVDSLVHRSGRTGRANKSGTNIIFTQKDELDFLRKCEKSLKIDISYQNSLEAVDPDKVQKIVDK
jgi:superfamily II DNA/RNA helicase